MRTMHVSAIACVVFMLITATVWATAQATAVTPVPPTVLAGPDVGFRVEGLRGGTTAVGTLVVKVNGQWIEAEPGTAPLRPIPLSRK